MQSSAVMRVAFVFLMASLTSLSASTSFQLHDPGRETRVAYDRYGVFIGTGTHQYRYYINDRDGLANAVGEGVYPNVEGLRQDPAFIAWRRDKPLSGNLWDDLNAGRNQEAFFEWASNHDQPIGLKQFYVGMVLENAGLYAQAIKAYQAVVIHFPTAYAHTTWGSPWYAGPAALDAIAWLIRQHPELGMRLDGGRMRIKNRYDDNPRNEEFSVDPGRIVAQAVPTPMPSRVLLSTLPVRRELGKGHVRLVQRSNGHWQMLVSDVPMIVRGVTYNVVPVGKSPDNGTLVVHRDWMLADENQNGKIDGPYDSWVDANRNNRQDPNEPVIGDFRLLQAMGANTLRLYHHEYNKALLRDLYGHYGIRVVIGDLLGAYTVGSDADWSEGTDYRDAAQRRRMLASVREMVESDKDEPYLLFWVLGNENNYGNGNNCRKYPDAYYSLVNEAARLIKSLDSQHPVAVANGDLTFIDKAAALCPDVDILAVNAYRGRHGMGDSFWQDTAELWGKPVLISEFGAPAYHRYKSTAGAEAEQAEFLKNNWNDIERNVGGGPGEGNCLGGIIYEWMDEWWKAGPAYDPAVHDAVGQFQGPFPDGWSYEEWYGIVSQGNGRLSPFLRQLRPAYDVFKNNLWNARAWAKRGLPK